MRLIGFGLVACVLALIAGAGVARADPPVLCAAYEAEWRRMPANANEAAVASLLSRVPATCPNLRAAIQARAARGTATGPAQRETRNRFEAGSALNPDCAACPALRYVPAGSFIMGEASAGATSPTRRVRIARAFAIGETEITADAYSACVNDGGCSRSRQTGSEANAPVTQVSHREAMEYAAWLSRFTGQRYRLPTEAEWEYAARAGRAEPPSPTCQNANAAPCAPHPRVHDAGSFQPNAWGQRDMIGNVSE